MSEQQDSDIIKEVEELLREARKPQYVSSSEATDEETDRKLAPQELYDAVVNLLPESRKILHALPQFISSSIDSSLRRERETRFEFNNELYQVHEDWPENFIRIVRLERDFSGKPTRIAELVEIDGGLVSDSDSRDSYIAYKSDTFYRTNPDDSTRKYPRYSTEKTLEKIREFWDRFK